MPFPTREVKLNPQLLHEQSVVKCLVRRTLFVNNLSCLASQKQCFSLGGIFPFQRLAHSASSYKDIHSLGRDNSCYARIVLAANLEVASKYGESASSCVAPYLLEVWGCSICSISTLGSKSWCYLLLCSTFWTLDQISLGPLKTSIYVFWHQ